MLGHLPSTSFVSASLQRLACPSLIWTADGIRTEGDLQSFAYCLPFQDEATSAYRAETKVCLVERYGGKGVSGNGGGVRCGWLGDMTVKGIGRTDLAGQGAPFWHSYGGTSLREAIREVIWGEIYNTALPHGAVRVEGVIGTGTCVPLRYTNSFGEDTCPRALILRRPFLRPAHYMRSLIFEPQPGFAAKYVSDAVRTAGAVANFDIGLRASLKANECDSLIELLHEAARRYSTQLAVSRAKRLLHGSVTPSNIGLDGRLLDFGMCSAVSDHGRIIIARGWPDAWRQHEPISQALGELCFYLRKYGRSFGVTEQTAASLRTCFDKQLDEVYRRELLKLSGIPLAVLCKLDGASVREVSSCFIDVVEAGNREPFKLLCPCPEYVPSMPRQMGAYHLGACMKACAKAHDQLQADFLLQPLIPEVALRNRMVAAYWTLRAASTQTYENSTTFDTFLKFNATRLNHDLNLLYAITLNRDIDELLANRDDIANFIDTRIRQASMLVADASEDYLTSDGSRILASPVTGVHAWDKQGSMLTLSDSDDNFSGLLH